MRVDIEIRDGMIKYSFVEMRGCACICGEEGERVVRAVV